MNWEKHGIEISKVRGGKGYCPLCHHTRKNKRDRELSVDIEKGLWNCHNCGFKGTAKEFDRMDKPRRIYARPQPKISTISDKTREWFKGRGIGQETVLKLKITASEEFMPQVNEKRNCICFNYFRDGELVNIKYRDGQKNFRMEKDAELIFYNLDSLKGKDSAIIVEGEMDCLSVVESGIEWVVSVPNGASKGSQRLEYLDNCWEAFEGITTIIVATDNDEPGTALKEELCRRLGKERCYTVKYPEGCKDLNDVLLKHGKAEIAEIIKNAEGYPLEGIVTAMDLYDDVSHIIEHGYPEGLRIGYEEFDKKLRWMESLFTVITGTPGAGKSTWLNNILIRLADKHDWRIAMFTPEKQPLSLLITELLEIKTGLQARSIDSGLLVKAMEWLNSQFYFMKIDEMDVSIDGILDKGRELVTYYGIKCLVIDPWNYVEHKIPSGYSETQYVSEALTKIKRFKDRYGVHVFLVAHPTKIKKVNGAFEVPTLYDIAGSAHFFNKSDNGIVVYRDFIKNITEIHIQKIRWHFLGELDIVHMKYDKFNKRFSELEPEPFSPSKF